MKLQIITKLQSVKMFLFLMFPKLLLRKSKKKNDSILARNKAMLDKSISDANILWMQTGKRHFVIFSDNKYIVCNKSTIDSINKKRKVKYKMVDVMNAAIYITPNSGYHAGNK